MNKTKARIISIGGSLVAGVVCVCFGGGIPFKDQWPLYEALRSTSSIIFAVIGAWLTILYPDAIKKVFSRNLLLDRDGGEDIELMVSNVRYSTVILGTIMVIGIVAQIAHQITWLLPFSAYLRAASFGLLGALTWLQFWSLLMTLAQAEMANEKLGDGKQKRKFVDDFHSESQTDDKY